MKNENNTVIDLHNKLPGHLESLVKATLAPQIRWQEVLPQFFSELKGLLMAFVSTNVLYPISHGFCYNISDERNTGLKRFYRFQGDI